MERALQKRAWKHHGTATKLSQGRRPGVPGRFGAPPASGPDGKLSRQTAS